MNKFFRQFDSIEEIFEFFMYLEEPEKKLNIENDNKFVTLKISLPSVSKSKEKIFKIKVPQIDLKDSDLIVKLCEEIKKIDILEAKLKYVFNCLGKTEEDFKTYEKFSEDFDKTIIKESKVIESIDDFNLIQKGIKHTLKKSIKDIKLLYRASKDGDNSNDFHSKCDNKGSTVTFIKTKDSRRFGGFTNKSWNKNNNWINDSNAFIFSLDNNECYYYNNSGNQIFGSSSSGPIWGDGKDINISSGCLSFENSSTKQSSSFNYKEKINALSGKEQFQVQDYETYQVILEE